MSVDRVLEACVESMVVSVKESARNDTWKVIKVLMMIEIINNSNNYYYYYNYNLQMLNLVLKQQLREAKAILSDIESILSERLLLTLFSFTAHQLILLVIAEGKEYEGCWADFVKFGNFAWIWFTIVTAAYAARSLKYKVGYESSA